jgi:hypothetical protein
MDRIVMLDIDGSFGEGGGQVLRTAVAAAAATATTERAATTASATWSGCVIVTVDNWVGSIANPPRKRTRSFPADRPGYRKYREQIAAMVVLGEGRRGPGNLVLGCAGAAPDLSSPLPPVIAYGMVETTQDQWSITVRDCVGNQVDVEMVTRRGEEIPALWEEKRRWTYSTWRPVEPSPATGARVREVVVDDALVLVVAPADKRVWLHDCRSVMNHLIPITNFYNELMLHKRIRTPETALRSSLFFDHHASYTDRELAASFVSYNAMRHRVDVERPPSHPEPGGLAHRLKRLLHLKA